jgi:hypothetical protein
LVYSLKCSLVHLSDHWRVIAQEQALTDATFNVLNNRTVTARTVDIVQDFQHLYNNQTGRRRSSFEIYIVTYPVDRDECRLGEELFDRMRERYFDTGLGFNIQTSGLSNVAPINGLQKRYVSVPLILREVFTTDSRLFLVYLNIC